jgi:hypothetical protein
VPESHLRHVPQYLSTNSSRTSGKITLVRAYLNNNISTAPAKFLPLRSLDPAFFTINTIYQQLVRSATAFEPALLHRQFFDTFILPLFSRDYIDNAWWKGKIFWRKELWRQDERY